VRGGRIASTNGYRHRGQWGEDTVDPKTCFLDPLPNYLQPAFSIYNLQAVLKPHVPCLGAMIPPHHSSARSRSSLLGVLDQHRCGCPQQLTVQRAVLFHGYAEVNNIPFFILTMIGFSISSRLIVLCGGGARGGGRLVGEGKLVREGRASASRHRGRCRQGGFWVLAIKAGSRSCHHGVCRQAGFGILSSKRVPSRWILSCAVKAGAGGQKRINLASGPDSVHGRCGRRRPPGCQLRSRGTHSTQPVREPVRKRKADRERIN